MAEAEFSRIDGTALIYETDGRIFVLEHDKKEPEDGSHIHRGMFFQPAMNVIEYLDDAGKYPYKKFHRFLRTSYLQGRTLMLLLISVDPEMPLEIRKMSAEAVWNALSDKGVRKWIKKRLSDFPLPSTVDVTGLPHPQLKEFILAC